MQSLDDISRLAQQIIWDRDYSARPTYLRVPIQIVRVIVYVYREFASGELNLRAMSLVYTTILSLVPLLAFGFSVLKGFGVQNQVEPLLRRYFVALGPEKSAEITTNIVEFVNNIDVRVLGAVGLGLLVYTIVTLMQKVEAACNHAWHVRNHRNFAERFSTFISVLTVGPLLVFAALAITGSVMNNALMQALTTYAPFGTVVRQLAHFAPFFLVIGAFTFLYLLVPNTPVRFRAALIGGTVAGILWQTAGMAFAFFVASATGYQAIYATFGTAMFFMIWLYVSWLILLLGASIAYYAQHPRIVLARARRWRFSYATFEGTALAILVRIVDAHYDQAPPLTVDALSELQQVPPEMLTRVLSALESARVLSRTASMPPAYVLSVPPDETRVADIVRALREYQAAGSKRVHLSDDPVMSSVIDRIDRSIDDALGELTLKALAVSSSETKPPEIVSVAN